MTTTTTTKFLVRNFCGQQPGRMDREFATRAQAIEYATAHADHTTHRITFSVYEHGTDPNGGAYTRLVMEINARAR